MQVIICDGCKGQSLSYVPILNNMGQPTKIYCPKCLNKWLTIREEPDAGTR